MSYLYLLAGEDMKLAEGELEGFLKSQGIDETLVRKQKLAETEVEPGQLKRLALTHEVSRKITELEKNRLEDFKPDFMPEKSFAVRTENLSGREIDKEKIEKVLGEKFSSSKNSVDLENPRTVIKAYIFDEKIILGEVIEDINRGLFGNRKNQNRPFSSPVSLDPVLARLLVNLSGVKPGEFILDPFCGTGGILIESGLCGIGVYGSDMSEEMVKGTKMNLDEYGVINHSIKQLEVSEAVESFDRDFSAVITDLPYGKSSAKTDGAVDDFLELVENFEGKIVFMWNEDEIGGFEADFSVYVHRNLTRHIFVV